MIAPALAGSLLVATLSAQGLEAWVDHLRPSADESRWAEIPWLPTFADGMREASAQGKPLLLWLMNGHPLGCT